MTIGERIKVLRKQKGMTQEKLAEQLCVSYQAVSKWECGLSCPDLSLIAPLTRLFGVSADELLGISDAEEDLMRKRYDSAMSQYRNGADHSGSYWWAKEAVAAYPENFGYLEWLALAEYRLAFDENLSADSSGEYFEELTDNSLRHFEAVIEGAADAEIYSRAVLGKIMILRFLERSEEADWSAEFEYPDACVTTATEALSLCDDGRALIKYLENEDG